MSVRQTAPRKRRAWRSLCILAGGAALVLLLLHQAERMARTNPRFMLPEWQIRHHNKHRKHEALPDAELGFLVPPHLRKPVQTTEFAYVKETDAKGFPNRDPWPATTDIVFLGDSLIVGEGVGFDGQFSTLVEQMLRGRRVVNLGMPAAGPERQYLIYQRFGAALRPQLVVACIYAASDFSNDFAFSAWRQAGQPTSFNQFRFELASPPDPRPRWHPGRIIARSRLIGMGRDRVERWLQGDRALPDRARFADGAELYFEKSILQFAVEETDANDPRIDNALTSLEKLRVLASQHQGNLLVMLIPSKEELFGVAPTTGAHNAVERLRQRLQQAQLPVLDLYAALRDSGKTQPPYFRSDIHLNQYGNRIVAEQFVSWWRQRHSAQ